MCYVALHAGAILVSVFTPTLEMVEFEPLFREFAERKRAAGQVCKYAIGCCLLFMLFGMLLRCVRRSVHKCTTCTTCPGICILPDLPNSIGSDYFTCLLMIQEVPEVFFVDDPKLFGTLGKVFPNAKLVHDGWHLEDRYSRCMPPNNTLKGIPFYFLVSYC